MKLKSKIIYNFLKIFPKKYLKIFEKFFDFKLNFNLINLLKQGIYIDVIYDIGAYHGKWSETLNKSSLRNKKFFLFEANEENEAHLKKLPFKFFIEILSDNEKQVEFYSLNSTGDSYYKEKTRLYDKDLDKKIRNTKTLDSVVKKENLPNPDFIKIDTQGSELDILKGGKETVSKCSLIYLECPIIEFNLNSPKFDDYIKYLDSIEFVPYDICEVHKLDNILIQIDILFIKKNIFNKIYPGEKFLDSFSLNQIT